MITFQLLYCYIAKLLNRKRQNENIRFQQFNNLKIKPAFSLIELLVVITIFMIVASLLSASYVTFERNQRLKNAALALKSDIRLAQNNALSGDKGPGGLCPATSTLIGWYVTVALNASSYSITGDCKGASETAFGTKTVSLPKGVTITALTYSGSPVDPVKILFRPLSYNASFHSGLAPPFTNISGSLINPLAGSAPLVIELSATQVTGKYQVIVQSSGEVNENKI